MFRLFLVLMVLLCSGVSAAEPPAESRQQEVAPPIAPSEWNTGTKVLLARSCIGEAGFRAQEECVAIAYVYAARAMQTGASFRTVMRQYSSAIKKHEQHRRPWLFEITAAGTRPTSWPRHLSWPRHREALFALMAVLDRWAAGEIPNPVPGANHYGSTQDLHRSDYFTEAMLVPAPAHFRNRFFDDTGVRKQIGMSLVRWRKKCGQQKR